VCTGISGSARIDLPSVRRALLYTQKYFPLLPHHVQEPTLGRYLRQPGLSLFSPPEKLSRQVPYGIAVLREPRLLSISLVPKVGTIRYLRYLKVLIRTFSLEIYG
jgi:hypothetical protein